MAAPPGHTELARRLASLPAGLPASLTVDALGLLAGTKPALRVFAAPLQDELLRWADTEGWAAAVDVDGVVVIASEPRVANQILRLDRSRTRHAHEMGILLGYPTCCSTRIATLGEAAIDQRCIEIERWSFRGRFRVIDPTGYRDGRAVLSHLPCSVACRASLALAERVLPSALAVRSHAPASQIATFLTGIIGDRQ
jgi:hypothetical protein